MIGVCLGAQLLAAALGANVFEGPTGEFGAGTVTPTDAAKSDKAFGGIDGEMPVVHWHGDTFDLPAGARAARRGSASYPHQAFRVGDNAYGLQFHVELTAAELPVLREHMPKGTVPRRGSAGER